MGNTPLDKSLVEQISETEGVDKVFGRMEMAGLSVSSDVGEGTITLISYDDNQFGWAKEELNEGSITPAIENTDRVLVTYQDGANWNVGDSIVLHTTSGDKQVTIAGILATSTASAVNGAGSSGYMICSEQTFTALVGDLGYTTIDVQFSSAGGDDTVSTIRSMIPSDSTVSDKRITNSESQSSYYTGAVFIYGFLIIIALITVFNIFNSMNASVASRTRQYGAMRAIGMSISQLYKMIAAEAFTYAFIGCVAGCVLGLPLNKIIFQYLIADKWGIGWKIPVGPLMLIVCLCIISALVAIKRPIKQMGKMEIVNIISVQ